MKKSKGKGLSKREKRIAERALKYAWDHSNCVAISQEDLFEECAKAAKKGGKG